MQSVLLPRYHPLDIFRFAAERQSRGEDVVLVVVENVSGASVRPVGTPMVVSAAGDYAGYVSNGCVDADIARHALDALKSDELMRISYGEGSPYLDIRLPCGGGVSVVIIPRPDANIIAKICQTFESREMVRLSFSDGLNFGAGFDYAPPLRVMAAGRGENLLMFARAAQSLGIDCVSYSPDADDIAKIKTMGADGSILTFGAVPDWRLDTRTAIVTLFHDHDYELPLLRSALESRAFYIGAMGSRKTHDARVAALALSDPSLDLSKLRGPIGLVPSMRDAGRLAVSVLAEIIAQEGAPF